MNPVLGFHRIGEYHYFNSLARSGTFLGDDKTEDFKTMESFASLIVDLHEHYHLMQDLLQGFCLWHWSFENQFAIAIAKSTSETASNHQILFPYHPFPEKRPHTFTADPTNTLDVAKKFYYCSNLIETWSSSSDFSKKIIEAELQCTPGLKSIIPSDAYRLTTIEMLECHAALQTELYLSHLIADSPKRFSKTAIDECFSLFRLTQMPEKYTRALRMVEERLAPIIAMPTKLYLDPLWGQMVNGHLYPLTAFLLDFALHVPPDPFAITPDPDKSATEAILPPLRFLKLLTFFEYGFKNIAKYERLFNDPTLYYSHLSIDLSGLISTADSISEERTYQAKKFTNNPNLSSRFLSFNEVTMLWQQELEMLDPIMKSFPRIYEIRKSALALRLRQPDVFTSLKPYAFRPSVGMPSFHVFTIDGQPRLKFHAYCGPLPSFTEGKYEPCSKDISEEASKNFKTGNWKNKSTRFSSVSVPFPFLFSQLEYQMFCQFCFALCFWGSLRCPMTESIGAFCPCKSRLIDCEKVDDPNSLPKEDCMLRSVIEKYFCSTEQIVKNRDSDV